MTVLPLSYAGGQRPAYNLTLMPGLVKNHDHAARLNDSPFMEAIEEIMAEDDVMVLVHGYLAGGFAGKDKCITAPDDVEGLQTRAAGKAFEQMLAGAGASIASMASSEIYNAMQTGVLDAANTSSSSFVSYRIYEQVACYTPAGDVCAVVHVSAAADEQIDLRRPDRGSRRRCWPPPPKAEAFYLEEAKKQDAASVEGVCRCRRRDRRDDAGGVRGVARAGAGDLLQGVRRGNAERPAAAGPGAVRRVIA
jgi:hypothetical protein